MLPTELYNFVNLYNVQPFPQFFLKGSFFLPQTNKNPAAPWQKQPWALQIFALQRMREALAEILFLRKNIICVFDTHRIHGTGIFLGGGFKYFLFSTPKIGEDFQFD